jgi:nitric oxide reductase subunit C
MESFSASALKGQTIWQKNNCTACHQFYGLGGYLGPDLTNIASNPNKGIEYAKAFFNSGVKAMPKFNFSEQEKNDLATFLTAIDQTGYYPNTNAEFGSNGWLTIKYK